MREDNSGNWRIEPGGDGTGHSATDEYISAKHAACGLPQKTSHRRAKMDQRSVLADRCAATRRDESSQC